MRDINTAASTGACAMNSAVEVFSSIAVDAVLVAAAIDTHADLLAQAVAAGKPVPCAKSGQPAIGAEEFAQVKPASSSSAVRAAGSLTKPRLQRR